MLALVKTSRGTRARAPRRPGARRSASTTSSIRVHKTGICGTDLHIESWDPWAAKTIKPPLVVGHEFVGEIVEVGSNVDRLPRRRPRLRRGPRRLRPLPPLPGRPAPPVRQHDRPRRRPRRRLRRVRRPADDERLAPLAGHRRGGRRDLRPVRQRGPHGARLPGPRRGRPRLGRRPDRADGHRGRPPRRRPPRRRVSEPNAVPPRARRRGWAPRSSSTRASATSRDVQRELGMVEGFDVALEMSGNAAALRGAIAAMAHGGGIAILGIPTAGDLARRQRDRLQDADAAGHLRPGDVRDLVQDDGHAPVRARHHARRSPTASGSATSRPPSPPPASGDSGKVIMDWTALIA